MESIAHKVESSGGIITVGDLSGRAEYRRVLRAAGRGDLVRVRQGVYASPASMLSTMVDVERIVPGGVVCLYNAWFHYQLCTAVAPAFCIAIESKRKVVVPSLIPVNLYYWKKENLEFGIVEKEISGYKVHITDLERSVCDAVKYRNKIGIELCAEILKSYIARKDRNFSRLREYARKLRVEKVLNTYLEMMLYE